MGVGKLHFGMKSRLMPQPNQTDEVGVDTSAAISVDAAPWSTPTRRESDVVQAFDEVEAAIAHATNVESHVVAESKEQLKPASIHAAEVSARPRGRFLAVLILVTAVGSVGYSLWTTFWRDAAFGIVTGKVTKISAPWEGTLSAIYVRAGDQVRQGDVLATVDDPELQAEIERLGDQLRSWQAELDAQTALLAIAARERNDKTTEIRAHYFDMRGELLAEQARYAELTNKLKRRRELANKRAYSEEETESLEFMAKGLLAKIENLCQATEAFEVRLQETPASDRTDQLKPWLAKIEATQAEIVRLREKQNRGVIRAPLNGTVVTVAGRIGQRTEAQALVELLPTNEFELQLFVEQGRIEQYQPGEEIEVVIDPATQPISCRIARIGTRLEKPEARVSARYRPDERLIPVLLEPIDLPAGFTLRLGSTIRQPTRFFGL